MICFLAGVDLEVDMADADFNGNILDMSTDMLNDWMNMILDFRHLGLYLCLCHVSEHVLVLLPAMGQRLDSEVGDISIRTELLASSTLKNG